MRMHQNEENEKEGLFSVFVHFLIFAGGCGQKDSRKKQPAIQETAEQTEKRHTRQRQENKQETVQEKTPADEQEEAAVGTGAATVLPMIVDYDYEAEYDQDSYETLISVDIPGSWL